MKALIKTIIATVAIASSAFAAGGAESEGSGFFVWLFVGFGALIVIFQMAPGLALFGSMVKGLFSTSSKEQSEKISK